MQIQIDSLIRTSRDESASGGIFKFTFDDSYHDVIAGLCERLYVQYAEEPVLDHKIGQVCQRDIHDFAILIKPLPV